MDNSLTDVTTTSSQHDVMPTRDVMSTAGCQLYEFVVCTVIIGTVCMFGLAGNVVSFFVLCKHKSDTAAIFLLQSMAVFDSLLLIVTLIIYVLPSVYPYTGALQVSINITIVNTMEYGCECEAQEKPTKRYYNYDQICL